MDVVDDHGCGAVVAYLPGIGGTGAMMQPCAVRLRESFRIIRLRYVAGGDDSYPALADSIAATLERASAHDVILLAESFGGGVAMHTALRYRERVAALGVVNSFAWYPWRRKLRLSRWMSHALGPRTYTWLRRRFGIPKLLGPRYEPELAATVASVRPTFDAAYRARIRMLASLDLRPRLSELTLPVALFAADHDRIVPSEACARDLQNRLPDATLRILPDTGHLVLPLDDLAWPEWLRELRNRADARLRS